MHNLSFKYQAFAILRVLMLCIVKLHILLISNVFILMKYLEQLNNIVIFQLPRSYTVVQFKFTVIKHFMKIAGFKYPNIWVMSEIMFM